MKRRRTSWPGSLLVLLVLVISTLRRSRVVDGWTSSGPTTTTTATTSCWKRAQKSHGWPTNKRIRTVNSFQFRMVSFPRREADADADLKTHSPLLEHNININKDTTMIDPRAHNETTRSTVVVVQSFLEHVYAAMESDTWLSLTIRCAKTAPASRNRPNQQQQQHVRGSLRMLVARPIVLASNKRKANTPTISSSRSSSSRRMIQVTFKYHSATDIAKNWEPSEFRTNLATVLQLSGDPYMDNDCITRIIPASEWDTSTDAQSSSSSSLIAAPTVLQSATLVTVPGTEWELQQLQTEKPKLRCRNKKTQSKQLPQQQQPAAAAAETSSWQQHDRIKHAGPIAVDAPIWQALSVTNAQGLLRPGMSSKFRQCQKFVEIVERLVLSTLVDAADYHHHHNTETTASPPLTVVDMGCGRAYLTFALHVALQASCSTRTKRMVQSRGIDVRPKLVREVSSIAASLNLSDTLTFETGTIDSFLASNNNNNHTNSATTDVLIALHACDTATDDALWSGICCGARVLVVAPCCHRQVRPQLDRHQAVAATPLADVWRHNIYRERAAETVTDALRALLLEYAGYQVQVFEFVGGEHTSKNVMITAVHPDPVVVVADVAVDKEQRSNKEPIEQKQQQLLDRIRALAALHGIQEQKLAEWMGIDLIVGKKEGRPATKQKAAPPPPLSTRSMPPLPK